MPDHMASESRDMLIGTEVAGPAKSHALLVAVSVAEF